MSGYQIVGLSILELFLFGACAVASEAMEGWDGVIAAVLSWVVINMAIVGFSLAVGVLP